MQKKYEFTGETICYKDHMLHRIRALVDVFRRGEVIAKAGDLGGWIESEYNLSHDNNAWIKDDAKVFEKARVEDDALVSGSATMRDRSSAYDEAIVCGEVQISGYSEVNDSAVVKDHVWLSERVSVSGRARISGRAWIRDTVAISGNSIVYGKPWISGNVILKDDAVIRDASDFMCIGPIGSRDDYTTFFRNAKGEIKVICGCFKGTIDSFLKKVEEVHSIDKHGITYRLEIDKHGITYRLAAEMAKAQIDTTPISEEEIERGLME